MITSPWLIAILSTFSIGLNKSYNLIYSIKVAERKNEDLFAPTKFTSYNYLLV